MHNETICALATKLGGALGIIRISGEKSLEILSRLFTKDLTAAAANTIVYGHIKDGEEIVDEVLVSIFRAPHSYTGENSAEISCHGSEYIANRILELLVKTGCRMAQPGEYTQRAYLNGKLDLSQAEAVADVIAATNRSTHLMAMSQLRGGISNELTQLRDKLLKLTSLLELELDFSEHEELEFADRSELLTLTQNILHHITRLADSFKTGQALKNGITVAIVGKTNVGKSTLLNKLLKEDRAIVSDVHGTTRDTVEDVMNIKGVEFRFVDTAGIRQTDDTVEQIGIERTYQTIEKARIVLWLLDSAPTEEETEEMEKRCKGKQLLIILNKSDLQHIDIPKRLSSFQTISISAKQGTNIEALEKKIYTSAQIPEIKDSDVIVTSLRQYDCLLSAEHNIERVLQSFDLQLSGDLIAEDLRMVLSDLSQITGQQQITPHEVLGNIFQNFCIGK